MERTELSRVRQEILFEILNTAVQAASFKKIHDLRIGLEQNLSAQVKAIRTAVHGGGARLTDLGLASGRLSQATALRTSAEANYQSLLTRLVSLLPRFDADRMSPDEIELDRLGIHLPPSLDDALTQAMEYSIAIRGARAELEKASAERDVTKTERWPKLTVNMQWQQGSFGNVSADSDAIFLGLNTPLYEGGARIAAAKSASYRHEASKETLTQEIRNLKQQVGELWARWQALQASCLAWDRSIADQTRTLRLTHEQRSGGGATEIDVLQAESIQLESRLQGVEQQLTRDRAKLQLLSQIGLLDFPVVKTVHSR